MSAAMARAVRCTLNTPLRHASAPSRTRLVLASSLLQNQIRWNSSAAATAVSEEPSANEVSIANEVPSAGADANSIALSKKGFGKSKQPTPELDQVVGRKRTAKTKYLDADLRKLTEEIQVIYNRQLALTRTWIGPYRVRSTVETGDRDLLPPRVQDGKVIVDERVIPNIWLRDNCQCSSCMHEATKQRLLDTFSIPTDIAIEKHSFDEDMLNIEWSDGHKSEYTQHFLAQTTNPKKHKAVLRQGFRDITLWDSSIASNPPKLNHSLTHDWNMRKLLERIRNYGFCYVDQTPFETPATTKKLLKRISFIRETHYGGFYDFTADLASKDTAYTNIALEAHTDTTYFSDPAGLQAFHLLSHTDGEGGASLLVDGFKVAEELYQIDKKAYKTLSTVNVHAHASGNEGISIQPYRGFPVLEHDPATGDLLRVRWNSSDRASIELPIEEVETWYDAARKFDALLKKKENEYWEQLTPGRVLIFDNWRVLHGRSQFTGKRRICGGYINRDDWISKYKMMVLGKEKVLGSLALS